MLIWSNPSILQLVADVIVKKAKLKAQSMLLVSRNFFECICCHHVALFNAKENIKIKILNVFTRAVINLLSLNSYLAKYVLNSTALFYIGCCFEVYLNMRGWHSGSIYLLAASVNYGSIWSVSAE